MKWRANQSRGILAGVVAKVRLVVQRFKQIRDHCEVIRMNAASIWAHLILAPAFKRNRSWRVHKNDAGSGARASLQSSKRESLFSRKSRRVVDDAAPVAKQQRCTPLGLAMNLRPLRVGQKLTGKSPAELV